MSVKPSELRDGPNIRVRLVNLIQDIEDQNCNVQELHISDDTLQEMIDGGWNAWGTTALDAFEKIQETPDPDECRKIVPRMVGFPVVWHAEKTQGIPLQPAQT